MYRRQIEEYLTHYQPSFLEDLLQAETLQDYLNEQEEAMLNARQQVLAQMQEKYPKMSHYQLEIEADQTVRETFLTPKS